MSTLPLLNTTSMVVVCTPVMGSACLPTLPLPRPSWLPALHVGLSLETSHSRTTFSTGPTPRFSIVLHSSSDNSTRPATLRRSWQCSMVCRAPSSLQTVLCFMPRRRLHQHLPRRPRLPPSASPVLSRPTVNPRVHLR